MNQQADERARREREAMAVVRRQVERDVEPPPRRAWQHLAALGVALLVSTVLFLGFDFFLTAMQRFMEIEPTEEAAAPEAPIPVFAVPGAEQDRSGAGGAIEAAGGDEPAPEPWLPALIESEQAERAVNRPEAEPPPGDQSQE